MTRSPRRKLAVDLFSGCGGVTTGLKMAGFMVSGAVELDVRACETYRLNHPEVDLLEADIRRVPARSILDRLSVGPGEIALLAGCPPCQGYSRIRTRNRLGATEDSRNDLVLDFLRFARVLRPQTVMMENVPGLAADPRFGKLLGSLHLMGYQTWNGVVDMADFGIAQRRRRLLLLAAKAFQPLPASRVEGRVTVREVFGRPRRRTDELSELPEKRKPETIELISRIPPDGGGRRDLPLEMQRDCHRRVDGFGDVFGRMRWDDVAPTITSGCGNPSKGRFLHPEEHRAISLREAALLQGFDSEYRFLPGHGREAIARMIGNALPPPFVRLHAGALRRDIDRAPESI